MKLESARAKARRDAEKKGHKLSRFARYENAQFYIATCTGCERTALVTRDYRNGKWSVEASKLARDCGASEENQNG